MIYEKESAKSQGAKNGQSPPRRGAGRHFVEVVVFKATQASTHATLPVLANRLCTRQTQDSRREAPSNLHRTAQQPQLQMV